MRRNTLHWLTVLALGMAGCNGDTAEPTAENGEVGAAGWEEVPSGLHGGLLGVWGKGETRLGEVI